MLFVFIFYPFHASYSLLMYLLQPIFRDWERTYQPNWKKLSVKQWASKVNNDNNFMVKKLAGKKMNAQVSELDLDIAMRTIKERFYVGIMGEMEESIKRFNIVMGIDETEGTTIKCMEEYFGHGVEKKNSNSHPKVSSACLLCVRVASDSFFSQPDSPIIILFLFRWRKEARSGQLLPKRMLWM